MRIAAANCTQHQYCESGDKRSGFSVEISERVRSGKTCKARKRVDHSHGSRRRGVAEDFCRIAQNTGRNAMSTQIMLNAATVISVELGKLIRHKNPAAPTSSGSAACQRRSRLLSECHPLNNIAKSATT